jgi:hypothetical protein
MASNLFYRGNFMNAQFISKFNFKIYLKMMSSA